MQEKIANTKEQSRYGLTALGLVASVRTVLLLIAHPGQRDALARLAAELLGRTGPST